METMEIRILAPRLCTKSSITAHLVGHPHYRTNSIHTFRIGNQGGGGGDLDPRQLRRVYPPHWRALVISIILFFTSVFDFGFGSITLPLTKVVSTYNPLVPLTLVICLL
jgi:hypothetical protein